MNVEELLQHKNVPYITQGGDYLVRCLNPDHEDRHPSMRVDKIMGIYNCLSCGFKGNIFNFFNEKVNYLQMRRELLQRKIKAKAAETVGITLPKDIVPYNKGNWRDIQCETYEKFGAFQHHAPEHIGRIVFPITSLTGKIVCLNGRHTTGGSPKYLFSPPGARLPLYPAASPIRGSIILVEGIFDMLNLYDKGLTNAICCFGTKNVNENKLSMLKMQGVDFIYIFFDGDPPGQTAAVEVKNLCERVEIPSKNIHVAGLDPGELTKEQVEGLRRKLYDYTKTELH